MENENTKLEELMNKQLKTQRITMVASIITAACFMILTIAVLTAVPKINKAVSSINGMMEEIQAIVDSTEELSRVGLEAVNEINKALPALTEASDSIASISKSLEDEGLPKLYQTLENLEALKKLQNINIEELNGAIKSLHDVVAPLARLFGN